MANWSNQVQRYLGFFEAPNYQTVLNGRPLFFVLTPGDMIGTNKFAGYEEVSEAFGQLRAAVTNLGMPSPYLVAMDFAAATAAANSVGFGFEAISNYAPHGADVGKTPYSTLSAIAADWWTSAENTGAKVVPPLTAGWDRRPRIENPVSWEPWQLPGVGISNYYARPTPQELGDHVRAARDFCAGNPSAV
jgi:hypothetical protein